MHLITHQKKFVGSGRKYIIELNTKSEILLRASNLPT